VPMTSRSRRAERDNQTMNTEMTNGECGFRHYITLLPNLGARGIRS
jgi:hypothetical protein